MTLNRVWNFDPVTWTYLLKKATAGGLSGTFGWIIATPFDNIKSVVQADTVRKRRIIKVCQDLYQENGFNRFLRGVTASAARGYPVGATMFVVYELVVLELNLWIR